jgi:hypothetical protein
MQSGIWRLLAIVGCAMPLFGAPQQLIQPPSLGFGATFAVLGGSAVNNSGPTVVTGNLGVSPGNTVNGFPPGSVNLGTTLRNDPIASQAQSDAAAAYNDLAHRGPCVQVSLTGPTTLVPGIYCVSPQTPLTGTVTLDAGGDPNSVWIFQATGPLTTAPQSSVIVVNSGCDGNVFWQVAGDVTLGAGSTFTGSILALGNVTLNAGAGMSGRVLALGRTSVVTLNGNNVTLCCSCPITLSDLPNGTVCTAYITTKIAANGGTAPYTFRVIDGALPPGLNGPAPDGTVSGTPTKEGSYKFTVQATDALGCTGARTYTINIACAIFLMPSATPPTPIVPFVLMQATVGEPYTQSFSINCGPSCPCILTSGTLPPGLSLSGCVLSGTPMTPGIFDFTLTSCCASQAYRIVVICPKSTTIVPTTLPDGMVCTPYSVPLAPTCVLGPATFLLTGGTLPSGITLSPGGLLSGLPTTPEISTFTVTATDGFSSESKAYTLEILPLQILPESLPPGIVGQQYDATIMATPGTQPYNFAVTAGSLPPPLILSANGQITGVPSTPGIYKFSVAATNSQSCRGAKDYEIDIKPPPPCPALTLQPLTLPPATAGVSYSQTIIASGGSGSYTYSVCSGSLPAGLQLNRATGVISGTPLMPGPITPQMASGSRFTICATDACPSTGSRAYTIQVTCPTITIPTSLPNGNVGASYNQTITATGGTPPYTFIVNSGSLPAGLSLAPDGTLSGTPTSTGNFCFSIRATDAFGCASITRDFAIIIDPAACPAGTVITLSPSAFPPAQPGVPYSQTITPSGGTAPYTFAITSGALPPGLTLNPATGTVSGVPTAQGVFNFTLTATDANGCIGTMGCNVVMTVDIPAFSASMIGILSILLAAIGVVGVAKATK